MANIKSAKKRIKVIDAKTARNKRVKNHVKEAIRAFEDAIAAGNVELAKEKFPVCEKQIMQAAAKGTLNKHAAARKVSRLAKRLNKVQA